MRTGLEVTSVTQILVFTPVKHYGSKLGNGFTHGLFSRSVTTSAGQWFGVVMSGSHRGHVWVMPGSRRGHAWVTSGSALVTAVVRGRGACGRGRSPNPARPPSPPVGATTGREGVGVTSGSRRGLPGLLLQRAQLGVVIEFPPARPKLKELLPSLMPCFGFGGRAIPHAHPQRWPCPPTQVAGLLVVTFVARTLT